MGPALNIDDFAGNAHEARFSALGGEPVHVGPAGWTVAASRPEPTFAELPLLEAGRPVEAPSWRGALGAGAGEGMRSIRFGGFEVVPSARALVRDGVVVELGSRAFDILMVLLNARGDIVSKDKIIREVWPTTIVVDSNLKVQLSLLRRALGVERWRIKTVSGRGYLIVVDDAAPLGPPLRRPAAANNAEGPLIIMIDAEPAVRDLMVRAITELARKFTGAANLSAVVNADG